MAETIAWLSKVMKPEHLHVILNHLPVLGLGLGIFALLLALLMKSRPAQIVGLAVILICSGSAYPVLRLGQEGYRNVRRIADEPGQDWLDAHMDRAEDWIGIYYALTALSLAALIVPRYKPRTAVPLAVLTLILSAASFGAGVWISDFGGKVRHSEFRTGPPPAGDE